jgi:hypothetical protein
MSAWPCCAIPARRWTASLRLFRVCRDVKSRTCSIWAAFPRRYGLTFGTSSPAEKLPRGSTATLGCTGFAIAGESVPYPQATKIAQARVAVLLVGAGPRPILRLRA